MPSVSEYYRNIYHVSGEVLEQSLSGDNLRKFSSCHGYVEDFFLWSNILREAHDDTVLHAALTEYQYSLYSLSIGQYRQAYAGLRLSLELFLASVCFSAHELHLREWLNGKRDVVWSALISSENGVLSKNFVKAFWPDVADEVIHYRALAQTVYRELSEFVHGNACTHGENSRTLGFNQNQFDSWCDKADTVRLVASFSLMCRHLNDLDESDQEKLEQSVLDDFLHLECVRDVLGVAVE